MTDHYERLEAGHRAPDLEPVRTALDAHEEEALRVALQASAERRAQ